MLPILMAILVLISIITIFAALIRSMMGVWLDYKARMAALDRIAGTSDEPLEESDIEELLDRQGAIASAGRGRGRMMTGACMIWFGIGSVVAGRVLRSGAIAVGLDLGGWISIALGLAVLIAGWIVWRFSLSRNGDSLAPPPKVAL